MPIPYFEGREKTGIKIPLLRINNSFEIFSKRYKNYTGLTPFGQGDFLFFRRPTIKIPLLIERAVLISDETKKR